VRPSCTLALVRVEEQKGGDGARHAANLHSRGTLTRRIRTWNPAADGALSAALPVRLLREADRQRPRHVHQSPGLAW
jgi:hypothetical protein